MSWSRSSSVKLCKQQSICHEPQQAACKWHKTLLLQISLSTKSGNTFHKLGYLTQRYTVVSSHAQLYNFNCNELQLKMITYWLSKELIRYRQNVDLPLFSPPQTTTVGLASTPCTQRGVDSPTTQHVHTTQ